MVIEIRFVMRQSLGGMKALAHGGGVIALGRAPIKDRSAAGVARARRRAKREALRRLGVDELVIRQIKAAELDANGPIRFTVKERAAA